MSLYVYYRISDKGNPKEKLSNASKYSCLTNAIKEFGNHNFYIIADNCNEATISFICSQGIEYEETSLGNSGSFLFLLNKILQERKDQDQIYLLEDDYLHRQGAKEVLEEGLSIAHYVTLYDHPDKYWSAKDKGNPFNGSTLQKSRIYVGNKVHWREANSTTMTFACTVATLKSDAAIWKRHCRGKLPRDFCAFIEITQRGIFGAPVFSFLPRHVVALAFLFKRTFSFRKPKRLISSIPAYATHAETKWLSPIVDWEGIK
ncbi:MAG TPA: hypothetical protein PLQ78_06150 [Flavipsychrobacter sp.]|jgi:hypothetical protein|nr:hypothetical protein [Flavipsychrobacter sp.]